MCHALSCHPECHALAVHGIDRHSHLSDANVGENTNTHTQHFMQQVSENVPEKSTNKLQSNLYKQVSQVLPLHKIMFFNFVTCIIFVLEVLPFA